MCGLGSYGWRKAFLTAHEPGQAHVLLWPLPGSPVLSKLNCGTLQEREVIWPSATDKESLVRSLTSHIFRSSQKGQGALISPTYLLLISGLPLLSRAAGSLFGTQNACSNRSARLSLWLLIPPFPTPHQASFSLWQRAVRCA